MNLSNDLLWRRWLVPVVSIVGLFAVLLFLFPFDTGYSTIRDPLGWALWTTWTTQTPEAQDYTYCLLVPFMVAYILYEKRLEVARTPLRGISLALGLIVFSLVLFWIGSRAGKQYVGCAAIQLLIAGVILWFWGRAVFAKLFFAWAVITFAWPLPFVDSTVAFPLRMIVSHLAYYVLNFVGIATVQMGTALISAANPGTGLKLGERFQIDVADPCSGLHSLLPLLMFSALYSYFFLRKAWRQWAVFLSAIPFTIVGNVFRIVMLVAGSLWWGSAFALGTDAEPSRYHEGCGFAVFAVVLGLECLFGYLLIFLECRLRGETGSSRLSPISLTVAAPMEGDETAPVADSSNHPARHLVPGWRSGVVLALAVLMAIAAWNNPGPALSKEAGVLMSLPEEVKLPNLDGGKFVGFDAPVSDAEHTILPKDTEFARKNYDDFHGHSVFFSIVLSGLQQYTIHPPQVCLIAQGWTITHEENVPVKLASGRELVVRNLSIERQQLNAQNEPVVVHAYYMYWYVADGISTPSRNTRNWVSSWDRIVHNRDHRWAYVIAMSPITESTRYDGLNGDQTKKMLADFIREIVPTFQKSELQEFGSN